MAYIILDKKNRSNGDPVGIRSIAEDDAALAKVLPDSLVPFCETIDISDELFNKIRLEQTAILWQDGNVVEDPEYDNPAGNYTQFKMDKYVDSMKATIRNHFAGDNYVDEESWINYIVSLNNLDFSTIEGDDIPEIIENKGVTYRSILQLPYKLNS